MRTSPSKSIARCIFLVSNALLACSGSNSPQASNDGPARAGALP